jgi:hypothetical protein
MTSIRFPTCPGSTVPGGRDGDELKAVVAATVTLAACQRSIELSNGQRVDPEYSAGRGVRQL